MILDAYGNPIKTELRRMPVRMPVMRARYDAAQTTNDNKRHWVNADDLSADAANSASVRKILRKRARYEVANNSYARGIVLTLANDCVGPGPSLQILTDDDGLNDTLEAAFREWAETIDLDAKLRAMRMAKTTDGEVFALLTSNPGLSTPIKLDLQLIEAECVASPQGNMIASHNEVDGVVLDTYGNPVRYWMLKHHPGSHSSWPGYALPVDASSMLHWYRMDRPGQHRGVPELTPALELFAQLRRYTLAVLTAAETAADFAAVLYTDAPANGEAEEGNTFLPVELERGMATTLPDGWRLGQVEAMQPTTTYKEFKAEILNEIARCLNLPYNIAACNSSGYNYASGRLDHQTYFKSIEVERSHLVQRVLNRIVNAWLEEAMLLSEFATLRRTNGVLPHTWFFRGREHVDPLKEANAQSKRLEDRSTNLAIEYAKEGRDWKVEVKQRLEEEKFIQKSLREIENANSEAA